MRHYTIFFILFCIFILSCKENKEQQITRLIKEWQGKEILFPKNLIFTHYAKDTVDYKIPQSDYKILVYIDSAGCTSCKLQLDKWNELIKYIYSVTNHNVAFIFIFQPKNNNDLYDILRLDYFEQPISVDYQNTFRKQNSLPSFFMFQTLLLDKNNKVIIIGNPIYNVAIKDLYIKQLIHGKQETSLPIITTAKINPVEVNLEKIKIRQTKKTAFIIQNTGDNPLVILETSTTCGCAVATFDKYPAKPGEALNLTVEITPKESGMFNETITIKCNIEKPIQLKIRGSAE